MWQWEEEDKEEQAGDEEEQSCRAVTTGQWWCRGYSVMYWSTMFNLYTILKRTTGVLVHFLTY
jgi:hypothetical protein